MPDVTVGLFDKDTMIYYVDPKIVVLDDPYSFKTVVVLKQESPNDKDWTDVNNILFRIKYRLKGTPIRRPDGLWVCDVEESNG